MELVLSVPGIMCNHCAHTITMELMELKGVKGVAVDVDKKRVDIRFEEPATETAVCGLLESINYPAAESEGKT